MATDRSLTTLLRALQSRPDGQDISRLLGSATNLLTLLSNPLNVTLLTAQLLSAPAVWQPPDGLPTTVRILSIFNSASIHFQSPKQSGPTVGGLAESSRLSKEKWATAVVKGADERSPRWRHVLVFSGLLLGFSEKHGQELPDNLLWTLERAIIKATNLALQEHELEDGLAAKSIAVTLSYVFDLLHDAQKASLNHDALLPYLYHPSLYDIDGLHSGYLLSIIDADVVEKSPGKFDWSDRSSTYVRAQRMASSPLVASLGPLSRLIAFSAENARDSNLLATLVEDLADFTRSLFVQWRQNKLSEIDVTEERTFLTEETLKKTLPLLWRILRSSMFAIIVILRSILGRVLGDARLRIDTAPFMAAQTLHILRNLYFISSRLGANTFSEYSFVYLTAMDILSKYPVQAEALLREVGPSETGSIAQHPLDRCHDLYFLNSAEHFAIMLSPQTCENFLIPAAEPYLGLGGDQRLQETFEAAHSVMLAVFATPQNTDIVTRHMDAYFDVLFEVFPHTLSARQFRIAVKTLIRVITTPSDISEAQPLLPSVLLEIVHFRLAHASTQPSPQASHRSAPAPGANQQPAVSEQAVLILTLIDALPFLPVPQLEDWLPIVAQSLHNVQDKQMLQVCRQRLWEVLSNGEMDVDRSGICVAWWSTRGGKEMVLSELSGRDEGPFMSGALVEACKL